MCLLSSQNKKQNEKEKDNTIVDKKKITDVHDDKYVKTENECDNNLNNDSCENNKKTMRLWTEKW